MSFDGIAMTGPETDWERYGEDDLQPYFSEYLSSGYRQECIHLIDVSFCRELTRSIGRYRVSRYFRASEDAGFHLDSASCMRLVYQLGIVSVCIDLGLKGKMQPFFVRGMQLDCRRPVGDEEFEIELSLLARRRFRTNLFYKAGISVCGGAFCGEIRFFLQDVDA